MVKRTLSISKNRYFRACIGRVSVYIDGFNLYHGLRSADRYAQINGGQGWKHCYWYDPKLIGQALTPTSCQFAGVNFFTARVLGAQETDAPEKAKKREAMRVRQTAVLDAIQARGTTPITGVYSPRLQKCYSCNTEWATFEEKMTDTRIAVQMVLDATKDLFDTCVIISADADIVPPLEAIKHEYPEKRRVVVAPPHRNPKQHLNQVADCFKLTRADLERCLLPDPTESANGFKIKKPTPWSNRHYPPPEKSSDSK